MILIYMKGRGEFRIIYRFFILLSNLYSDLSLPSNCNTVSTICSKTLGPAISPLGEIEGRELEGKERGSARGGRRKGGTMETREETREEGRRES